MATVCPVCSKKYSTKYNLNKHLASNSQCGDQRIVFECEHCEYKTYTKSSFTKHVNNCKYVYAAECVAEVKEELEEIEASKANLEGVLKKMEREKIKISKELFRTKKSLEEIKEVNKNLEEEIVNLKISLAEGKGQIKVYKECPGTVNNYVNTKLLQVKCDTIRPFTIETVREDINDGKYTFEQYIKAERGLVEFISDMTSFEDQRSYVCTDSSRKKFHRLLDSREWKEDNGATFLNKVLDELKEPATIYYKKITDMMTGPLEDRDLADILYDKTKPMTMGIVNPRTKDRELTFAKIRSEVKNLASV